MFSCSNCSFTLEVSKILFLEGGGSVVDSLAQGYPFLKSPGPSVPTSAFPRTLFTPSQEPESSLATVSFAGPGTMTSLRNISEHPETEAGKQLTTETRRMQPCQAECLKKRP